MPYWEIYVHLVWVTKNRESLLVGERVLVAERAIRGTCRDLGSVVHALGVVDDHVHLAVSIPPRLAIADLMKVVKGSSSHLLNHSGNGSGLFAWQAEYGALSFGKRSLATVVDYVVNQADRHASGRLLAPFELTERPFTKP